VGQQFKMLKQLQQMQAKMAKIQEDLGAKTVIGTAGGGVVEVVVNGHQKVLSVTVKPEVVDPADVDMLQDLEPGDGRRDGGDGASTRLDGVADVGNSRCPWLRSRRRWPA